MEQRGLFLFSDGGILSEISFATLFEYIRLYSFFLLQGLKALHSPHTGIADYGAVTNCLVKLFKADGGNTYTNFEVNKFTPGQQSSDASVCIHGKDKVSEKTIDRTR